MRIAPADPGSPTPPPASSPATASAAGGPRDDDVALRVVRLALLVRLAAVAICLFALIGTELDYRTALAVLGLAATSVLGLSDERVLHLVIRRPLVAMADIAVVLVVVVALGVENPLTLGVLSTALIVGVLFRGPMAAILGTTLAAGYLVVAASEDVGDTGFVVVLGIPLTIGCLVAVGQAIRAIEQQFHAAQERLALALRAAAVEEERGRFAREVHDGLAKSLQGLALGAAALPSWLERDGAEAATQARELSAGAQEAVREARSLLSQLRADRPDEPFGAVLRESLAAWADRYGGEVGYSGADHVPLDTRVRYELLASLREALTNIEKHAEGAPVDVLLRVEGDVAYLVVRDEGPGFDPRSVPAREQEGHFGLRGLTERMASVGGRASVESAPGYGATVVLAAPLLAATGVDAPVDPRRGVPATGPGAGVDANRSGTELWTT